MLRSRDNSKQDGKSLCCKLVIHLFENTTPYCHVDLNLHLDLDPCVPLSLPINKLEMSLCVRKEFPFCVTSSSKAHKEFKMHPTWSFLDGNWHKRSAANKARKVQTFQSWICHDWIYGVKSRIYATLHIDKSIKSSRYAPTVLLTEKS